MKLKKLVKSEIDNNNIHIEITDDFSEVGGGSLPLEKLPTKCLVISLINYSTQGFENNLRKYKNPIIARVYKDKVYFDLRTIKDEELAIVSKGIKFALENLEECNRWST